MSEAFLAFLAIFIESITSFSFICKKSECRKALKSHHLDFAYVKCLHCSQVASPVKTKLKPFLFWITTHFLMY